MQDEGGKEGGKGILLKSTVSIEKEGGAGKKGDFLKKYVGLFRKVFLKKYFNPFRGVIFFQKD